LHKSHVEVKLYSILRYALFAIAIAAGTSQPAVRHFAYNALAPSFTDVEVAFTTTNGNELCISYGLPRTAEKGAREVIGVLAGDAANPDQPIQAALKSALRQKILPTKETWKLWSTPQEMAAA
jgi:hypothetical protein